MEEAINKIITVLSICGGIILAIVALKKEASTQFTPDMVNTAQEIVNTLEYEIERESSFTEAE